MSTVSSSSSSTISSSSAAAQTIPFPLISTPSTSSSSSSFFPMVFPHPRMVVAGTFDILHEGHYLLFHTAFSFGQHVEIWISDDAMRNAKAQKTGQILQSYEIRKQNVENWCNQQTIDNVAEFRKKYPSLTLYSSSSSTNISSAVNNDNNPHHHNSDTSSTISHPPPPTVPSQFLYQGRYSIHELHDPYGPSIADVSYTAITCSDETKEGCFSINRIRKEKGMKPIDIYCTPLAIDNKGDKLSSTALRALQRANTRSRNE